MFVEPPQVRVPQHLGPVVVKFGAGKSSGALLAGLLAHGQLDPRRGDVVVFNNTSAEHPLTYDFVEKAAKACREEGVPFFVLKYTTYEEEGCGFRHPTYLFEDPVVGAMSMDGSAYKDMVSRSRQLPTIFRRICTHHLKVRTTERFLKDWFGGQHEIGLVGNADGSCADLEKDYARYCRKGGAFSIHEYGIYHEWLASRPACRRPQRFEDYAGVDLQFRGLGTKCHWRRNSFLNAMGLRADEPRRIAKMRFANDQCKGGEILVAPLNEAGIGKPHVLAFWEMQDPAYSPIFPLHCDISNCVWCYIKGDRVMVELQTHMEAWEKTLDEPWKTMCAKHGPHKIEWWQEFESRFGRAILDDDQRNMDIIHLRMNRASYQQIKDKAAGASLSLDFDAPGISCFGCTD